MPKLISLINDWIAIKSTIVLGTMWCAYAFVLLCVAPALFPTQQTNILYLSNCFQLIFLPLLMVGQNLMGRAAEQRAQEDHEAIMSEFVIVKDLHAELRVILAADNLSDVPEEQ